MCIQIKVLCRGLANVICAHALSNNSIPAKATKLKHGEMKVLTMLDVVSRCYKKMIAFLTQYLVHT